MKNAFREYIATLSDAEKVELIDNYVRLETEGALGDEPLRRHARALLAQLGIDAYNITLCMRDLAMESYREFANRYLKEHNL